MGMILSLSTLAFLLMVQVACAADTTAPKVHTIPSVALEFGKEATLTCGYDSTVYAVYWRYQSGTSSMEPLVTLDQHYQVGERSGPGYENGRFNITDDYSLVIHDVQVHDEGRYTCEVSDFATGRVFRNQTDVTVDALAEQPFVRIRQCEDEEEDEVENVPCIIHAKPDQHNVELSCSVVRVKPKVELFWISSEQWDKKMNTSTLRTVDRSDGAYDQTLTININTSQYINQSFTCVAEGLAVSGKANRTIEVFVITLKQGLLDSPDVNTVNVTRIAVISAVATLTFTLILILIVILLLYKKTSRSGTGKSTDNKEGGDTSNEADGNEGSKLLDTSNEADGNEGSKLLGTGKSTDNKEGGDTSNEADGNEGSKLLENKKSEEQKAIETNRKRNDIKEEIQNQVKDSTPLYLGVFGNREAGKSSFIDSLIRAFSGGDVACREERQSIRETVWRRTIKWPSDFIAICEIEDMENAKPKKLKQLLKPISDGDKRPDDVIHYPIVVYDIGQHERGGPNEKFLSSFSKAVKRNISEYPILVLTHIAPSDMSAISDDSRHSIANRLSSETNIPLGDIFFSGIDKDNHSEHEDEILQLLEILLKCVKRVKSEAAKKQSQHRKRAKVRWNRMNIMHNAFKPQTSEQREEKEEKTQEPSQSVTIEIR